MKPITLNLASRPFRNNTLLAAVMTVVGVSLVGMTAYNLYVYVGYGSAYARLQQEQASDRAKIAKLQVEERRLADEVRARNFRHAFERGKLASELVRKSAFSWTRLFNTLEQVVPPDVVMTALRPNIGADEINLRIEGVAKNSMAFLTLQERLLKSPWFTRVFPGGERQLNPSLPDITFFLTCNYLPEGMTSPDKVAGATTAPDGSAPTDAAAGTAAEPVAAGQAAAGPAPAPATGTASAAGTPKPPPATAPVTVASADPAAVGRDGRPLAERAAMTLLAPGGVRIGEAAGAVGTGKRGKSAKKGDAAPKPAAAKPPAPAATSAATPPASLPGRNRNAGTASKPASGPAATAASAESAAPDPLPVKPAGATSTHSGPINRTDAAGRVFDPNNARTAPPLQQAARASQPKPPVLPGTAERLDLPLSFTATPVGEVYDRLATAHGVRFRIDPGVDRSQPVTVNLQGRRLEDALALVAGQARHRVRRIADGSYTVLAVGGDAALNDAPVAEEPLGEETP